MDNCCEPDEGYVQENHIRRFRRLARSMAKLLEEIRETCPRANMYLEDTGNWILLSGDSHDHNGWSMRPRQDRAVVMEVVPHSGGGAW